jgi:hypothetical protein
VGVCVAVDVTVSVGGTKIVGVIVGSSETLIPGVGDMTVCDPAWQAESANSVVRKIQVIFFIVCSSVNDGH